MIWSFFFVSFELLWHFSAISQEFQIFLADISLIYDLTGVEDFIRCITEKKRIYLRDKNTKFVVYCKITDKFLSSTHRSICYILHTYRNRSKHRMTKTKPTYYWIKTCSKQQVQIFKIAKIKFKKLRISIALTFYVLKHLNKRIRATKA